MRLAQALVACFCLGALAAAPSAGAGGPASARLAQLPLVEVAAAGGGDTLAVLYSGDGGWADIDAGLASNFARAGVPVVGVNSLRYFWSLRTAPEAAADLTAVLDHYMVAWRRPKIILVGYSFGADALPAIVASLSPQLRAHVRLMALVGVGRTGELKFQPGSWLNVSSAGAYRIAPVLAGLGTLPRVCIFGDHDPHEACTRFSPGEVRAMRLAGGHHFDGDYAPVSAAILKSAGL
jgi:type IV secretory pathway VirJ component